MILISHRGNIDGKDTLKENTVEYIQSAIDLGFDVEVDVWNIDGHLLLGHDGPVKEQEVSIDFLQKKEIWCHAKNIDALYELVLNGVHCFFHDSDEVVLTSKQILWTFPGNALTCKSVCVLPESQKDNPGIDNCYGICSDFIDRYK